MASASASRKLLVINPNSSKGMTESLQALIKAKWDQHDQDFFTSPSGPASINNDEDGQESADHCGPALLKEGLLGSHDDFVVACYSQHPLVPWLRQHFDAHPDTMKDKRALGIFEASVDLSMRILNGRSDAAQYGIVSTGNYWKSNLSDKIKAMEPRAAFSKFSDVETTGLTAGELHELPRAEVAQRMKEATTRLVSRGDVRVVCLGCAAMAGLDEVVRSACVEQLGYFRGQDIAIVDGTLAALALLRGDRV